MNDGIDSMEKVFSASGYKFEKVESGISYDFSNCNDPVIKSLSDEMKRLKEAIKEREAFLKSIPQGSVVDVVDKDTGEQYTVYPPLRRSSTTMRMTKINT